MSIPIQGQASQKLAELRTKTDRELTVLLHRAIECCLQCALRAEYAEAEALYARILILVSLVPVQEFPVLQSGLAELRGKLDELCFADSGLVS